MSISCGHCKGKHGSIREVRQCAMSNGVSAGRIAEENGLAGERPASPASPGRIPSGYRSANGHVPDHGAHGGPVKTKARAAEGMYRKAGTIYKVQKAVHGSKLNYAKRLVQVLANDPKTGKPKFKFEYAPGFVYELRSEHMLTLDQAKEFGALYGTCCVCGRTLTREESIAAGIGPVCVTKF
jgi:hypothetical protein